MPGAAGGGEQQKLELGPPRPLRTAGPAPGSPRGLGTIPAPRAPAQAEAQPRPGFPALPTYASCGSTAAGPSWAWPARGSCAAHRPGPGWAPPGCAGWPAWSQAGGRCSEREPRARGWRAEGAELLAAAGEGPGRTGRRPCRARGAVRGRGAEALTPRSCHSFQPRHHPPLGTGSPNYPSTAEKAGRRAQTGAPFPWPQLVSGGPLPPSPTQWLWSEHVYRISHGAHTLTHSQQLCNKPVTILTELAEQQVTPQTGCWDSNPDPSPPCTSPTTPPKCM